MVVVKDPRGMPISTRMLTSIAIISASPVGSATPNTSAPSWWNCRSRPRCARSWRNMGPR
jgi:hypothetical protein